MRCIFLDKHIFRAYDIRGIVGENFNEKEIFLIALSLKDFFLEKNVKSILISRDSRLSGELFEKILFLGLNFDFENNSFNKTFDVNFSGIVSTPINYFSNYNNFFDAGIMITASHLPKQYNGLKLTVFGSKVFGSEINAIGNKALEYEKILEQKNFDFESFFKKAFEEFDLLKEKFSFEFFDIEKKYIEYVYNNILSFEKKILEEFNIDEKKLLEHKKNIKLFLDYGNGTSGSTVKTLLSLLNYDNSVGFFEKPDGNFPNHIANPEEESSLNVLKENINSCSENFVLGVAFDGDADRFRIVTKKEAVHSDMLLIFLSKNVLEEYYSDSYVKNNYSNSIVFDLKCSMFLKEKILEYKGVPVENKTGHTNIEKTLREKKALLAGELSGHTFFNSYYFGFDDAIYSFFRTLTYFLKEKLKGNVFENVIFSNPYFSTPEIRFSLKDDSQKFLFIKILKEYLDKNNYSYSNIDGFKIVYDDYWFLIRQSNTENKISYRIEAKTKEKLEIAKKEVEKIISYVKEKL